ncbi:MAG: dihydropyrimidinase [Bdellovibrionales bacterium]|nr:dihydropyrimidinase [Bdellovibrionales bacterium]
MSILIKNGTVVTSAATTKADVYIEGEKVHTIGTNLSMKADKTIDASGCYLFPGGIDAHTHMDLPFMGTSSSDDFETGTLAGLHGGTTTIIDFAFQKQGDTLQNALNVWHEKADGKAVGDYAFHMVVTDFNEKSRAEIGPMVARHGISSFKTFMAYKGALMVDDKSLVGLFHEVEKYGGIVTTHAENGDLIDTLKAEHIAKGNLTPKFHAITRPPIAESEATGRIADLAFEGKHPLYIVHMTCEDAVNRVRQAMLRNQKIHVETCIQYLLLDDTVYEEPDFGGAKYVMSPPIRKKKDQEVLWAGIDQGLVEVVATDHCPFCMDQKRAGEKDFSKIPNGGPVIEDRMELLFSEGVVKRGMSLQKFVDVTSTAPARIFGMAPKKGTIAVGSDADIVIFDPTKKHKISHKTRHMRVDYNMFEGWEVTGKCRQTILRGTLAIDDGKALVGKGFGKYISRAKYAQPLN